MQVIGTHNGTFHCDEALAVYLLRLTKAYDGAGTCAAHAFLLYLLNIVADLKRTRDPAVLDTCTVVVDVGGVYDESQQRFDHHQRGFTEIFGHGFNTKLSSAGLVYKYVVGGFCVSGCMTLTVIPRHFGREIIASRLKTTPDDSRVDTLWLKLYKVRPCLHTC